MDYRELKRSLDKLARNPGLNEISPDPLELVHRYDDDRDCEVAGIIASSLAYGNVRSIVRSGQRVLDLLGPTPSLSLAKMAERDALDLLRGFRHRFTKGSDMARLWMMLRNALEAHGSLEALFLKGYSRKDLHIGTALERFERAMLAYPAPGIDRYESRRRIVSRIDFLLPLPSRGSACKRMNLFLRWMIRPRDGIDLGVWRKVPPAHLIIPLDVHVARIARNLGLLTRKQSDWKTACELTNALKQLDPLDPVRYDFAICRLGILGQCSPGMPAAGCKDCGLKSVCQLSGASGQKKHWMKSPHCKSIGEYKNAKH